MECTFEIGDRVECILDYPDDNGDITVGCAGTICCFSDDDNSVGVCWDEKVSGGHDCCHNCEYGHGWYVNPKYICIVETEDFEVDEEMLNAFFSELVVRK